MKWPDFEYCGIQCDLRHLHPCTIRFERPATDGQTPEVFTVDVRFTSHCFTRAPKENEAYDPRQLYPDREELRLFDFQRYELSKGLPDIIRGLPARKPRHNRTRQNYFTVELIDANGVRVDYEIFFKVKKPRRGRLEMLVETAFVRDLEHQSSRPSGRPVGFWIILHNTLHNIKIRA